MEIPTASPSPSSGGLSAFKDRLGRWRSRSLFVEFALPDYPAYFTLAEEDREVDGIVYVSVKRKYLEYQDPSEHLFAQAVFGSFQCWRAVCSSPDLLPSVEEWREELELNLRSKAFNALRLKAESGDVAAAKAIAFGALPGTKPNHYQAPGRPRKAGYVPAPSKSPTPDHEKAAYDRLFGTGPIPVTPAPPFTVTSDAGN